MGIYEEIKQIRLFVFVMQRHESKHQLKVSYTILFPNQIFFV